MKTVKDGAPWNGRGASETPTFTAGEIRPARTEKSAHAYRLAETPSGKLVLQGLVAWTEGCAGGLEWRTLETVQLAEGDGE